MTDQYQPTNINGPRNPTRLADSDAELNLDDLFVVVDSSTGATSEVRALVETVEMLDATRGDGERITNTTLANHLGTGVKQATRRAKRAIKLGWLINREQRKSYPADYALGEPMPETEGLPLLDDDRVDTDDNEYVNGFSFKNEGVDMLTPITDGDISPHTPDSDDTADELPDCPKCGRNEWAYSPNGDLLCPCGNSVKGGIS